MTKITFLFLGICKNYKNKNKQKNSFFFPIKEPQTLFPKTQQKLPPDLRNRKSTK